MGGKEFGNSNLDSGIEFGNSNLETSLLLLHVIMRKFGKVLSGSVSSRKWDLLLFLHKRFALLRLALMKPLLVMEEFQSLVTHLNRTRDLTSSHVRISRTSSCGRYLDDIDSFLLISEPETLAA